MGLGELGEDKRWGEVRRMRKKDRRKEKKERTRYWLWEQINIESDG